MTSPDHRSAYEALTLPVSLSDDVGGRGGGGGGRQGGGGRRGIGQVLRVNLSGPALVNWIAVAIFAAITIIALLAPVLAPFDPIQPTGRPSQPPLGPEHLLGTDKIGRDLLSRILFGLRISWMAALAIVAIGLGVGSLVGVVAGTFGGWVDTVLMRVTDVFLALPTTLVAVAVAAALGPGLGNTMIAISVVWWPYYARIIRGEVRAIAVRPHVEAARMAGASWPRIMIFHLVPGMVPTAIVTASLDVGATVLALASLSFLGLGQAAPAPELGADTVRTLSELLTSWWIPIMPGLAVALLTLIANTTGDAVRRLFQGRR